MMRQYQCIRFQLLPAVGQSSQRGRKHIAAKNCQPMLVMSKAKPQRGVVGRKFTV